jgi:hypothetical protein
MPPDTNKSGETRKSLGDRILGDGNGSKVWEYALKTLVPVSVIMGSALVVHEVRLSVIESNRFTTKDAAVLKEQIYTSFPQDWLQSQIAEIKVELNYGFQRVEARFDKVEERLRSLESRKP